MNNISILITKDHGLVVTHEKPEVFVTNEDFNRILKNPDLVISLIDNYIGHDFVLGILGDEVNDIYEESHTIEIPDEIDTKVEGLHYSNLI